MEKDSHTEIDLAKMAGYLFIICKRYKLVIILSCFAAICTSIYQAYKNPKITKSFYTKKYTLITFVQPTGLYIDCINGITEKESQVQELNTNNNIITAIKSIKANASNKRENEDPLVEVKIESYNNELTDSIMNMVIRYVNSNDFIKSELHSKKEQYTEVIKTIDQQLLSLSSDETIKKEINSTFLKSSYIELTKEKQAMERKLQKRNSLEVVYSNNNFPIKSNMDIYLLNSTLLLILGFLTGLAIAVSIFLFKEKNVKIRVILEKTN